MAGKAKDMKGGKGGKGDAEEEAEGVFAYRENAECEICGEKEKRLRRDRDRKTGRARGMLCRRCTVGVWAIERGIVDNKGRLKPEWRRRGTPHEAS